MALAFKESSNLAAAYGIAVTGTMCISSLIYFYVTRYNWGWPLWKSLLLIGMFLCFDLSYFGANLLKFFDGGWFAVSVALLLFVIMVTWRDGRAILRKHFEEAQVPLDILMQDITTYKLVRSPGTAFFLSVSPMGTPVVLLQLLRHNETLPERVFILSIISTDTPYVAHEKRLEITDKGLGFYRIVASYGFMETPSVPEIIDLANERGLDVDSYATSFYLGRESLLTTGPSKMARWRKALFTFLSRNAWNVSTFFSIPPGRVLELGSQKVQDNGPGVPREMQSRIFDKFVRLDQGDVSGGSGLGLTISKEIIRAHRGSIWLESEPGQGSTFTFTLPQAGR